MLRTYSMTLTMLLPVKSHQPVFIVSQLDVFIFFFRSLMLEQENKEKEKDKNYTSPAAETESSKLINEQCIDPYPANTECD